MSRAIWPGRSAEGSSGGRRRRARAASTGRALLLGLAAAALVAGTVSQLAGNAGRAAADAGYQVVGNQVVDPNGAHFVPYGFVVECLASVSLNCAAPHAHYPATDIEQIQAAATAWHSNVVRLQVAQEHLLDESPYDAAYLSMIDAAVNAANAAGMIAIVSLQEEQYGGPVLPTQTAVSFWKIMAAHFAASPMVFFDLYNEPRLSESAVGGSAQVPWDIWRNGGTVAGVTYVGMQALVDDIRTAGATNIIMAEGNDFATTLLGLPQWQLSGTNLVYGIKPEVASPDVAPETWYADFGQLAAQVPVVPQSFTDNISSGSCQPNSPTVVPSFLDYLQSIDLGLIDYSLDPGNATLAHSDYASPTTYPGSTIACRPSTNPDPTNTVGDGADLMSWYAANSRPAVP